MEIEDEEEKNPNPKRMQNNHTRVVVQDHLCKQNRDKNKWCCVGLCIDVGILL